MFSVSAELLSMLGKKMLSILGKTGSFPLVGPLLFYCRFFPTFFYFGR